MLLEKMLDGVEAEHLSGPSPGTVEVRAVTSDSREAGEGALFVAVPGLNRDGHDFVLEASRKGCAAILVERWVEGLESFHHSSVLRVSRGRSALALCAANLFGRPGEELPLVGVTGTNGKTTVTWLVASAAEEAGLEVGLLGTVGVRRRGEISRAVHTTPAPEILQSLLADVLRDGGEIGLMEVSSHALDQERVLGCRFVAAGFTGLSRDHLDYHPDMEHYFRAKERLFREHLEDGAQALVFTDDEHGVRLHGALQAEGRVVPVSVGVQAALGKESDGELDGPRVRVRNADLSIDGLRAEIELIDGRRIEVTSPLVGAHNLANLTMAAGLAHAAGIDAEHIAKGLSGCRGVPGRLERISDPREPEGGERHVFVDYAHTDDAILRVIDSLRSLTPRGTRIIAVVGCGGDRDKGKRPLMGRAAASADVVVVTSDNPRSEDPEAIARDMLPGLDGACYTVEVDRRAAIELSVGMARPGDVVLVAGKGHETEQVVKGEARPFDDGAVSRDALGRVGAGTRPLPRRSVAGGGSVWG